VRVTLLCGVLCLALGTWSRDALPAPASLDARLLAEPVQEAVREPPFRTRVGGVEYVIEPRDAYDISGLVVSLHDAASWWDRVHEAWNDHLNLVDLCVVWGRNASSGIYRELRFNNDETTCRMSSSAEADWQSFDNAQASNNHLITDKPEVARLLRGIHVGDQVRLRGYLVDYTTLRDGKPFAQRTTSESRTDEGCEVIYVATVQTLGTSGTAARFAFAAGIVLLLLGAAAGVFVLRSGRHPG
jgi:hypothetical protein